MVGRARQLFEFARRGSEPLIDSYFAERQDFGADVRELTSKFPAVIGPMQQRLPLAFPAENIARLAIHLQLTDVPSDRGPAFDLPCIFVPKPPASIIAAIPLKPAARVFAVYPALAAPHRKRLAGRNPEEVHPGV